MLLTLTNPVENITHVTLAACEEDDPDDINSTAKVFHSLSSIFYETWTLKMAGVSFSLAELSTRWQQLLHSSFKEQIQSIRDRQRHRLWQVFTTCLKYPPSEPSGWEGRLSPSQRQSSRVPLPAPSGGPHARLTDAGPPQPPQAVCLGLFRDELRGSARVKEELWAQNGASP